MVRFPFCILAPMMFIVALSAGCSETSRPTGEVQGRVLLDDTPYSNAEVFFMNLTSGDHGKAPIQTDGTFRIGKELPVGEYTVYLAPKSTGSGEKDDGQPQAVTMDTSVPDKYWNEASSDIKIEVKEGKNDVVVKLVKE